MSEFGSDDSLDIALLSGGVSSERDVSIASGRAVAAALQTAGHCVACFDPAEVELAAINWAQFDACFIALHGGAGEDGRIQQALDELGVPYTGSGPAASRLAMSKSAAKECFERQGVPTPPSFLFHAFDHLSEIARRLDSLGFPLVVKPDGQGCSLGVGLARDHDELAECIALAARYESLLLAERMVRGREFTVALIDRQPLPALEIAHQRRLFDYDAKFQCRGTAIEPVDAADPLLPRVLRAALDAAAAVDTRGLARVDLIADDTGQPWVLEVNTVPGLTPRSLAPRAALLSGMDLPRFCQRLLSACLTTSEVMA